MDVMDMGHGILHGVHIVGLIELIVWDPCDLGIQGLEFPKSRALMQTPSIVGPLFIRPPTKGSPNL